MLTASWSWMSHTNVTLRMLYHLQNSYFGINIYFCMFSSFQEMTMHDSTTEELPVVLLSRCLSFVSSYELDSK